jgi:sulfide:quinone oxidoreductase
MKRVTILGGGIGGVEAAIRLREKGFPVTLVSDREYLYIYPLSIWIPTGDADFDDVTIPLTKLSEIHGFEFINDKVLSINTESDRVVLENTELDYDYLIIALGGNKVLHKGIKHTLSVCGKPEDSLKLHGKLKELVRNGSGRISIGFGGNPKDPSGVRGGPAFEVIFNILNHLKKKGIRKGFELSFFAPMEIPGARLGEENARRIFKVFEREGIGMYFGKKIKEFTENGVVFEDNSRLESDLPMFIAATTGHSVFRNSDLPLNESGFIKINNYCEIINEDGAEDSNGNCNEFAIGDSAAIDGPPWRAKQGHLSEAMALVAARNIENREKGSPVRESYIPHVNILCLMDTGTGGGLVYRSSTLNFMVPLPVVGHWLKKAWGWYYKNSKLKRIPRAPLP